MFLRKIPKKISIGALRPSLWTLALGLLLAPAWGQVNVTTQHNDNARTGANLSETTLNTTNVNVTQFGKLFSCPTDGQIYAQPLIVSGVAIPSHGTHNMLYTATMHNSVYGFDADNGAQMWTINLGPSIPAADVQAVSDIQIEIGILSDPVIDTSTNTMYVVSRNEQPTGTFTQWLNALDITTGAQKFGGPKQIVAQYPGAGDGSVGGQVIFNPKTQNQRPALLLNNGVVYISWASHNDIGPFHGWIVGYNASTLAQTSVFNTSPNISSDGIWQAGNGPAADAAGNIYFLTGNGPNSNAATGTFGESFIKLGVNADKTTTVADWFEPFDVATLDGNDQDISAGGGMLLPGTSLLVGGGKSGKIYVLNTANMGHFQSGSDSQIHQWWQAATGHLHSAEIYWNAPTSGPSIYCWAEYDHLKQFQFNTGTQLFNTTAVAQSTMPVPGGMPGGMLSISANGSTAGSGVIWASHPLSQDANHATVPGIIQAFDANNVAHELWNSTQFGARDDIGMFAKDSASTVANGKLYKASFSNRVDVYGILASPGLPIPGQIEAEDYNPGGEGVGYHDTTPGNNGNGGYRYDDVDISSTTDPDTNPPTTIGPLRVQNADAGDWLKYNVNIASTGTYNFQMRTACDFDSRSLHVEMDGVNVTGSVPAPNNGTYTSFVTTQVNGINLTAGQHVMKISFDTGLVDLNWVNWISVSGVPVITSPATASGTVGSAFSYQITASNSPTSFGGTTLPAGTSVNTGTGLISGTPTTATVYNSNVTATNANGTGNKNVTITISNPAAPVVTSAGTASGTVGTAFSYQITATNSPTSYGGTSLPAGTSVNTGTGLISGTPTTATVYNSNVSATNVGGTGNKAVTITINPAGSTPYNVNAIYTSGTVFATGGLDSFGDAYLASELGTTATYNGSTFTFGGANALDGWSNVTVNLPAGTYTTLNMVGTASGGIAHGQTFTVNYTDATNSVFTVQMNDWTSTTTQAGETIVTTMAHAAKSDGTLLTGNHVLHGYALTLNGKSVASITLPTARGVVMLGFAGVTSTVPVITSALTKTGTVGTALTYNITATNSPTSYNATPLPASLSVNTGTGLISGTPSASGTTNTTISATNASGTGNAVLVFTINPAGAPPVITSSLTASGTTGTAFNYNITATNSPTSYNATSLPTGLSVNTGTGLISGTPTVQGIYSIPISATNASGTGNATLVATIGSPVTAFNINAIYTSGTTFPSNGGLDSFGTAYLSSELGTSCTYNTSSFTFGAANAVDGWSNVTVNLAPGTYTSLDMVGTASGGIAHGQTFTVNYTDGTNSVFTVQMNDWTSTTTQAGETKVVTMAHAAKSDGTLLTGNHVLHGYTLTLTGHSVKNIVLPTARGVVMLGFKGH